VLTPKTTFISFRKQPPNPASWEEQPSLKSLFKNKVRKWLLAIGIT